FVDAVHGTHVDTRAVLGVFAGFGYYVGHLRSDLRALATISSAPMIPVRKIESTIRIATDGSASETLQG
ncbi:MAG TPA: hypothetical protein VJ865_00615, partial [Gemmatimonadaceae bacterium]|nr:hypothetical protein [Gemmatimonadaceae bacterium]